MKLVPDRSELKAAVLRVIGLTSLILLGVVGGFWWFTSMPGSSFSGEAPTLADAEKARVLRLRAHVDKLADELVPRNFTSPENYLAAADYIESTLEADGWTVSRQPVPTGGKNTFPNLIAELPDAPKGPPIILGAHYDSPGPSPGADDNASGVAVGLEMARTLARTRPDRAIRFVFFVNEEPPFFRTDEMGSRHYAKSLRDAGEEIDVMYSLEMLGFYSDDPGSQRVYPILEWFYPDRGDFVAFVSNLDNRGAVTESIGLFREVATLPSEGITAPTEVKGIDFSDHHSFWVYDYPALMVTDTAFLRNPHYHEMTDTSATLDYEAMSRVVDGMLHVVAAYGKD